MKQFLSILFALGYMLSGMAQEARLYMESDERVSVEINAPISGYAQESFLNAEFRLPPYDRHQIRFEADSIIGISVTFGNSYLKLILIEGDSVLLKHVNDTVIVSGTNAEGHRLYLNKIIGNYTTSPSNIIKKEMKGIRDFSSYDKVIDSQYIFPINKELDSLVNLRLISSLFAEAAMIDHCNNIFTALYNDIEWNWTSESNFEVLEEQKNQLLELNETIKTERLTMSAAQAAVYPQSQSYIELKSELDFEALSDIQRKELLKGFAKKLPDRFQKYLTLPKELCAILIVEHYMYISEDKFNGKSRKEASLLRRYILRELSDCEIVKQLSAKETSKIR